VRVEPDDRGPECADDADSTFAAVRRRLFGIAYRVLGSDEAEDVVQETWLRWRASDREAVRNPAAFLARTTTHLALNVAQSARSRREKYVGQWLPEPVDTHDDPALGAERSEALELAVLLLLEKLGPRERAVYVLSEAFAYSYAEIAEMLEISEANARQLASRARRFLAGERRRAVSVEEHRRLFDAFLSAARAGGPVNDPLAERCSRKTPRIKAKCWEPCGFLTGNPAEKDLVSSDDSQLFVPRSPRQRRA